MENKKERFIEAWKWHINELNYLGYPLLNASKTAEFYYELMIMMNRLDQLVEIAADEDF